MIEINDASERVVAIGVQTDSDNESFLAMMEELELLIDTAGGELVGRMTQKLTSPQSKTLFGKGKLEELKDLIQAEGAQMVVSLNELSPSSNQYLEDILDLKVIDRIQLILDIFAQRARSQAGKLQVELAQYEYLLPRIVGQGSQLSRLGGGIGTRGPGETQLETDRRYIRSRISKINEDIDQLEAHRKRTRQRRQSGREFNIGLVGYTNAGKSTLLEVLTDSETYVKDQLFATLDPLTRKMNIKGQDAFTLTDTVGFIENLPTQLIHAFKSTLEEIKYVDLLLHVVDASHPSRHIHEETVQSLLKDLDMDHLPILTVYNKKDRLQEDAFVPSLFPWILISAKDPEDIGRLKESIWEACIDIAEYFEVEVYPDEGDLMALYQQKTLIQSIDFDAENEVYHLKGYRRKLYQTKETQP